MGLFNDTRSIRDKGKPRDSGIKPTDAGLKGIITYHSAKSLDQVQLILIADMTHNVSPVTPEGLCFI